MANVTLPPWAGNGETLPHAVARMRSQGFSDEQIAGQVQKWHPGWTAQQVTAKTGILTGGKTAPPKAPAKGQGPESGTLTSFNANPSQPIRRYVPAYKGEKPAGYEALPPRFPGDRMPNQRPFYSAPVDKRTGLEQSVDRQVTPLLAKGSKFGSPSLTIPTTVAGDLLANLGGGPSLLAVAHAAQQHNALQTGAELAGILPFGRLGKAIKGTEEGLAAVRAGEDVAKANGYVGSRAAEINQMIHETPTPTGRPLGHEPLASKREVAANGGGNGKPPIPTKNGSTPPTPPGQPGDVIKALKGAGQARNQQNVLHSVERTKRITEAERIMNEVGGMEGHHLAMKALSGELPKLKFSGGKNLDIPTLFEHVQNHPDLRPFEKVRVRNALIKLSNEVVPQHNEIKLLKKAFGPEAANWVKKVSLAKKIGGAAGELINVPRAVMSSFDLSAPFRQGLVAGTTHPVLFARNFKPMLKAFKSENAYQGIMDDIVSRPNFDRYNKAGLGITDLESGLTKREEQWFGENLAEKIPIAGHGIRASGRAYVGFLNKTRADVFDSLLSDAEKAGRDINDEKMLKDIAKAVNSATGRGSGPKAIQSWLPALNTIFFSPRLLFSRLDYLNPVNYTRLDPIARQEYLKGSLSLLGTVGTVLTLAKLAGAEVNTNPLSADFAKIKYGNTRVDILGGFQQPVRLLAQLASGKITSSTTGKTLTLGPEGPGHLSRFDIGLRFAQSKLAPVPSFVTDVSKGTQFGGQKLNWGFNHNNPVFQRMIPLLAQDARDIYSNKGPGPHGLGPAIGAYGLGAFGIGLQTYGPKQTNGPTIVPFPGFSGGSSGGVSTQPSGVTLPPWAS